jgi:Protein of unknown function (DUF2637)
VSGDRYRPLTAAAVLLVAAIAAVVSYMHVATLALHYGQPPLAAYLLPLSIDGMVATSSLVLLRSARAGVSAPWLARGGLVLAGWPAVAFVVSAETAISMSRRRVASGNRPAVTATARPKRAATRRPAAADTEAAILSALATRPQMTNAELANAIGTSERTARRYRTRLATASTT